MPFGFTPSLKRPSLKRPSLGSPLSYAKNAAKGAVSGVRTAAEKGKHAVGSVGHAVGSVGHAVGSVGHATAVAAVRTGRTVAETGKKVVSTTINVAKKAERALDLAKKAKRLAGEVKDVYYTLGRLKEVMKDMHTNAKQVRDVINSDDVLKEFFENQKNNRKLYANAIRKLVESYKIQSPDPPPALQEFSDDEQEKAKEYSHWAEKIYDEESSWFNFVEEESGGKVLIYEKAKKTDSFSTYSMVRKENTLIITIKGTSTLNDAFIDITANTGTFTFDNETHYIHKGFFDSAQIISNRILNQISGDMERRREHEIRDLNYERDKESMIRNMIRIERIVVNGHSLGGATAHVTGLILYEKFNNLNIFNDSFKDFIIIGYAPGTTFANIGPNINEYINKYDKLRVLSLVNKKDMVPRLSVKNGLVILAVIAKIHKYLTAGNAQDLSEIAKIRDDTTHEYMEEDKLKAMPPLNTSIIGKILFFDEGKFSPVEKLNIFTLQRDSLTNHLMQNYILALDPELAKEVKKAELAKEAKKAEQAPPSGGRRKTKTKRRKRNKTRKNKKTKKSKKSKKSKRRRRRRRTRRSKK